MKQCAHMQRVRHPESDAFMRLKVPTPPCSAEELTTAKRNRKERLSAGGAQLQARQLHEKRKGRLRILIAVVDVEPVAFVLNGHVRIGRACSRRRPTHSEQLPRDLLPVERVTVAVASDRDDAARR